MKKIQKKMSCKTFLRKSWNTNFVSKFKIKIRGN